MINHFFDKEFDMNKRMENSKQYNHFIRNCQALPVIKINQKSVRLKCFDYDQSIESNEIIRENINKYWGTFDLTLNNKEEVFI